MLTTVTSYAQTDPTDSIPDDPGALKVYTYQNMSFGAFTRSGSGGTLTLSNTSVRSATGSIIPVNLGVLFHKAIFEVEAPPNSIVSISVGPSVNLTNGTGGSISLNIGVSDKGTIFTTTASPPSRTQVAFGGTLTVGNSTASPPGAYNGTLYVTFNQE